MSEALDQHLGKKYEQGFITEVESQTLPPGLDESTVEKISCKFIKVDLTFLGSRTCMHVYIDLN